MKKQPDYEFEVERICADPTPAQALQIAHDLKFKQTQKAAVSNLEAWGPYDFYITVEAHPSVIDPQEFLTYLKELLKTVNNKVMGQVIHPDTNPLSNRSGILLGYVTAEYLHQIYAHITFRVGSGLKRFTFEDLVAVVMDSSNGIVLKSTRTPVFSPRDCRTSLVIDIGGSEALAHHNLALNSLGRRDKLLDDIYRLFVRKLERLV